MNRLFRVLFLSGSRFMGGSTSLNLGLQYTVKGSNPGRVINTLLVALRFEVAKVGCKMKPISLYFLSTLAPQHPHPHPPPVPCRVYMPRYWTFNLYSVHTDRTDPDLQSFAKRQPLSTAWRLHVVQNNAHPRQAIVHFGPVSWRPTTVK